MMTNHKTITVFCSKTIGRSKIWSNTIICNVNLHESDQLLITDKEMKSSDEIIIRIPAAELPKYYVDPYTWKGLSAEEALSFFTLKKGDYIAIGEIEDEVSSSTDIITRYNAFEIVKVVDNLSASPYSAHIKLVVK